MYFLSASSDLQYNAESPLYIRAINGNLKDVPCSTEWQESVRSKAGLFVPLPLIQSKHPHCLA